MKKLIIKIILCLFITNSITAQKFIKSISIEKNESFVSNEYFGESDLQIFKTSDYNDFYELSASNIESQNYLVSFLKIKINDSDFVLKCSYSKDGIVKTISISSKVKAEAEKFVTSKNIVGQPCTRYNYDIWECIKHILGV